MRIFYLLLFFFSASLIFATTNVHASDFTFDYAVSYRILQSGKTLVTQDVILTNQQTHLFAQNFTLSITSEKITNATARDTRGPISPQVVTSKGQTIITIPFNEQVVGIGKQLPFRIEYESGDIAQKKGRIWEIIIPGVVKQPEIGAYTVKVNVPDTFGAPAYVSPPSETSLTWTKNEFYGKGITMAFGDYQHFRVNLKYQLENITSRKQLQEITLPPDTAYQKVVVSRISPKPQQVLLDEDRNWLAQYELAPKSESEITFEGSILTYAHPIASSQPLTVKKIEDYTSEQQYWETTEALKARARELGSPQAIYTDIVSSFSYNYDRVRPGISRLGSAYIFDHPTEAVCMEFTDAFVSLTRSLGIPAQAVHGYAYTTNPRLQPLSLEGDVLHAWAQYYDPERNLFIPVDPTWGNTTSGIDYFSNWDFNHITFAVLGTQSDYPYPAGAFRTQDSGKNVYVEVLSDPLTVAPPQISLTMLPKSTLAAGHTKELFVEIKNIGNNLLTNGEITVSGDAEFQADPEKKLEIPPYGHDIYKISVKPRFSLTSTTLPITISLNGQSYTQTVSVSPFYRPYLTPLLAVLTGIILIWSILRRYAKK